MPESEKQRVQLAKAQHVGEEGYEYEEIRFLRSQKPEPLTWSHTCLQENLQLQLPHASSN